MVEVVASGYLALWSWVGIMVADGEKKRIDESDPFLYILIICMVRDVPSIHAMPAPYSCVHDLVQSCSHLCSITVYK